MGSENSKKPIVFVFGAKKDDVDGRKRNLSAINTQVAYRAHERRREKKSRQRAQAKGDGKVDQPSTSNDLEPSTNASTSNANFNNFNVNQSQVLKAESTTEKSTFPVRPQGFSHILHLSNNSSTQQVFALNQDAKPRTHDARRESDQSSDSSSDHDAASNDVWSASPASGRHSSPATDLTSLSPMTPAPLNAYFDRALDPFFRLPVPATDREQWLVHFYFREMGHIGFGTHSNSLFCPDRDWVSKYVSTKPLCFHWILILAEEFLGMVGGVPNQAEMIERKAKAYGALNSILKSKVVDRDEGISGIMYAAIVDTARTSMHLMALDRLINDTGGFEAFLAGPLGTVHPEHVATVYAFGRCPIANINDLEAIIFRFVNTLQELHELAKYEDEEKRRIRNRRPWDALSRQVIDGNGTLVPSNHDEHFRYFVKAQQDCFSSECVGPPVNAILDTSAGYSTQARHFAVLTQLLLILKEFDYSYLAKAMFLKRLTYVAEMSSARDPKTGRACLTNGGLLLINSFVRQEVQIYFDRTRTLAKGVKIGMIVVDFLKIFPLLQMQTRAVTMSWLRDWLCPNDRFEGMQFHHMHKDDFAAIGAEVRESWFRGTSRAP